MPKMKELAVKKKSKKKINKILIKKVREKLNETLELEKRKMTEKKQ